MKCCDKHLFLTCGIVLLAVLALTVAATGQSQVLTVEQCIEKALATDLTVIRAESSLKQSEANLLSAYGAFLPTLDLSLTRSMRRNDETRIFDRVELIFRDTNYTERSHSMSAGLEARLTLFDGFGNWTNLASSKASQSAAKHNLSQAQLNAVYNIKTKYFGLLQAQALLEQRKKAVERSEELMKISETKFELGSSAKSDVLKTKVRLSEAQLNLLTAENNVATAQGNLNYAIGSSVNDDITVAEYEAADVSLSLDEVTRAAITNNRQLLSTRESLIAARNDLRYARKGYLPNIGLYASKDWDRFKSDVFPDESWGNSQTLTLAGTVSFNIFNRFATRRSTGTAKASLRTAEYEVLDTRRDVEREAREAYLNLKLQAKARELADERLECAREDFKFEQEKYTLGAATILDILTAEANLMEAEADKVAKKYDYYLAIARLHTVMGTLE